MSRVVPRTIRPGPSPRSHRAGVDSAPPHSPEVQAVLDEQNQGAAPKVARNLRMAYVATVTLHDGEGDALHTTRC